MLRKFTRIQEAMLRYANSDVINALEEMDMLYYKGDDNESRIRNLIIFMNWVYYVNGMCRIDPGYVQGRWYFTYDDNLNIILHFGSYVQDDPYLIRRNLEDVEKKLRKKKEWYWKHSLPATQIECFLKSMEEYE